MPMTQAVTRHRRFRFQPKNNPVRNRSLMSPPPMASRPSSFSIPSTRSKARTPPPPDQADGAVQRPPERLGDEEKSDDK